MAPARPAYATIVFALGRKTGQIAPVAPRMRLWLTAGTTRALVLSCKRSLLEVTCPDLLRRPRTCVGRTLTHIASVGAYGVVVGLQGSPTGDNDPRVGSARAQRFCEIVAAVAKHLFRAQ